MPGSAMAQMKMAPVSGGAVAIANAWARATASANASSAVYFTMTAQAPDELTGASTPVAAMASLHQNTMDHGIMRMLPVAALPVAPGQPMTLSPGHYHLMLTGLKQKLVKGQKFPLTLHFRHAGAVTTIVTVQGLGARGPAAPGGAMNMNMTMPMDKSPN
jgi:copper(I)-binding protein